jgi:hypothetical protein
MTLGKTRAERTLTADVQAYLHETLGADTRVRRWSGVQKLPYFLQDAFDLHELQLRDKQILLASGRKERLPALSTLRTQLDKLAHIAERPVVFAMSTLASYERKRLVEKKIQFVVPGNQLYLPDLGIDFREYFRQSKEEVTAFTPATQAVFIAALLRGEWKDELRLGEMIAELGYTAMTLSRAVRELASAGLITASQAGRVRGLQVNHSPAKAWEQAGPFLRNPVKRAIWIDYRGRAKTLRPLLAGLSALASYSMLAEPAHCVYALSLAQWKIAEEAGAEALPAPQSEASEWQVWSYSPNLMKRAIRVDPLSLTLSLKDEQDDRVQQALDELRSHFPW